MSDSRLCLLVFGVVGGVLALFAWDRCAQPSAQFHFVDLAHSFRQGRLDTDTPRKRWEKVAADKSAPRGYADAVKRQTTNVDGSRRGWNDWASYRTLKLKSGERLAGVFPWRDQKDQKRKSEFHALNGDLYSLDCRRDVKSGCWGTRKEDVKYHVSFPPFPAIAMLPLTYIWGYNVNDVLFTLFFGAMNGLLMFLLLQSLARRGHSQRSRSDNLWLTAMFVFGTVHFFSAVRGEVWFTALILGVTFNLCAIWAAIDLRRPLVAGLFVALGLATRTPLVFSSVFILFVALFPRRDLATPVTPPVRRLLKLVVFAIPVAGGLGLLMTYNYLRFESVFEFGHRYLQEGARQAIREHGLMSGWFLPQNLSAALVNPPVITFEGGFPIRISRHGLGLLFTTPALLLLPVSPNRTRLFWAAVATAFVVSLPGLFYQNSGWEQFGYRFGLDWLPFLFVALSVGGRPLTGRVKVVILLGIVVNAFGAVTFGRMPSIYY